MKLCVCLGSDWQKQWPIYITKSDLLELRIDLMFPNGATASQILDALNPILTQHPRNLILTCRPTAISQELRHTLFLSILPFCPAYLDLEHDTPPCFRISLHAVAQKSTTRIITSYHNFEGTPELSLLHTITSDALLNGAHLVKIVTLCQDPWDEARLLSLYKESGFANKIVAFGFGRFALTSRLHAAALGAPLLYVAPDNGATTAPGQPRFTQFQEHLMNIL